MDNRRIILPGDEALSRRQHKQFERLAQTAVTIGKLPEMVSRIVDPALTHFSRSLQETDVTFGALVELLIDKGVFTLEEAEMKHAEVVERLMTQPKNLSPALSEAIKASKTPASVERLAEPTEESAARRMVEGA